MEDTKAIIDALLENIALASPILCAAEMCDVSKERGCIAQDIFAYFFLQHVLVLKALQFCETTAQVSRIRKFIDKLSALSNIIAKPVFTDKDQERVNRMLDDISDFRLFV